MVEFEELEVEGVAGEPVRLPLTTGPATGFSWQLWLPAGVVRIEDEPAPEPEPGTELGGGEGGYVQVTAPSGEHVITARLARPWEDDEPLREVRIHLRVA